MKLKNLPENNCSAASFILMVFFLTMLLGWCDKKLEKMSSNAQK